MARVRDHAAEYAALKARAQAAGLSTRAYRRARKENPLKYGAPRTQQTIRRRLVKFEPIKSANVTRRPANLQEQIVRAHHSRNEPAYPDSIQRHANRATPEQAKRFDQLIRQWDGKGPFWIEDSDYEELAFLLWYKDA